ncbi:MAG TPA: hypothetical protein DIT07_05190, partial [Sphingobacteriaceae bacterium]|nr:hypothetical protein [Sphingobacteriaceae bacterium]
WQSSETLDRIFGIDKNDDRSIAGWLEIVHPDEKQKLDEYLRLEVIGKRKSFNKEYRIVTINDKQTKWVCGFGDVKFDDSGNITEMIGTIQDITGRKKAEENLKQSEKRFRVLIEKGDDMITLSANDGELIYGSPSITRVLGYSVDEFLNKSAYDFIYPDEIPGLIENTTEISQTRGKSFYSQLRLLHKNNNWIWCEVTITNMLDEPGINALVSNFRDITQRKEAEENLRKSEKRYRYLFENNPMPIWIIDLNTFKFLEVNEMAIMQYGYSRKEFLSMTAMDIRPDEEKMHFKQSDHAFEINSTNYNRGIWNHRKKDGTIIQAEIIAYDVIYEGVPAQFILSNDVTEREKAEENLKQSESKLKEAQKIAQIGSWELNFATNLSLWSEETCRIYGLSPEENKQTYSSWLSFIHPED